MIVYPVDVANGIDLPVPMLEISLCRRGLQNTLALFDRRLRLQTGLGHHRTRHANILTLAPLQQKLVNHYLSGLMSYFNVMITFNVRKK